MRHLTVISFTAALLAGSTVNAYAWWDTGHMAIAALAYEALEPAVRHEVDGLIKLNPDYSKWINGVPAADQAKFAFMRAALWADDIKKPNSGYVRDKVTAVTAGDNKGYDDKIQHDYWHYIDIPFTKDGSHVTAPPNPNALTQMRILTDTLGSNADDKLRSFDLVWILHIAGDLHQPLHGTALFGATLPVDGDQGGNKVLVTTPTVSTPGSMHLVWDQQLGGTPTGGTADPKVALDLLASLPPADAKAGSIIDPGIWLVESFVLAQNTVYVAPVGDGAGPYALDQAYLDRALALAKSQGALAGLRLGNLINAALR